MAHTESITRRIKQRSVGVNASINKEIKHLQRLLVSYSFTEGVPRGQYYFILSKIKKLRKQSFRMKSFE